MRSCGLPVYLSVLHNCQRMLTQLTFSLLGGREFSHSTKLAQKKRGWRIIFSVFLYFVLICFFYYYLFCFVKKWKAIHICVCECYYSCAPCCLWVYCWLFLILSGGHHVTDFVICYWKSIWGLEINVPVGAEVDEISGRIRTLSSVPCEMVNLRKTTTKKLLHTLEL